MEHRNRWLGFLAVGLAAVALLVAVTGRSYGPRPFERGPRGGFYGPYAGERATPQSGADARQAPDADAWGRSRHWHPEPPMRPEHPSFDRGPRFGHGPHLPLFAWPAMMLRGVRDALLALVLIVLGLRLLRGQPGPGNEPHTGETRRL